MTKHSTADTFPSLVHIVNNAAKNTEVFVSLQDQAFVSFGKRLRGGIAGSQDSFFFFFEEGVILVFKQTQVCMESVQTSSGEPPSALWGISLCGHPGITLAPASRGLAIGN